MTADLLATTNAAADETEVDTNLSALDFGVARYGSAGEGSVALTALPKTSRGSRSGWSLSWGRLEHRVVR
jgi:hypothetical protein